MKGRWFYAFVTFATAIALTGCNGLEVNLSTGRGDDSSGRTSSIDLGGDDTSYGEDLSDKGVYEGIPDDGTNDFTVTCISGTAGCYTIIDNVLTFTQVSEDSEYSITGSLEGNIVVDTGDDYKFDLEMNGFSLKTATTNPIIVYSGSEVGLKAKKGTKNYIYDNREQIDETDTTLYSGAIHAVVDLEIGGKGELVVASQYNNGIHTKNDLQVKNLSLLVSCKDNALKGNDSVELTDCTVELIASQGDGIKTTNSDISNKGNQRGTITITNSYVDIYSACDGLDAAYDVDILGSSTVLNIYTDKYSAYSEEVTATSNGSYYIRSSSQNYTYSVQYYNSDADVIWENATYSTSVFSGRNTYYYYTVAKHSEYSKMRVFVYASGTAQGQATTYKSVSDYLTPNVSYDTVSVSQRGNSWTYDWTNYATTTNPGGMGGGMNEGNSDKGAYSTKGIKANNQIDITDGTINVKAYDDAVHANSDVALENGATPTGNVTIEGGTLHLYSNDDGIHADGTLTVQAGVIDIQYSYEGLEGTTVVLNGGNVSIKANDDGINATGSNGTTITVQGGTHYIHCNGDGVDSNSGSSYSAIVFKGGNMVIISTSSGNSAIDSDGGYQYTGGYVVAIMPSGGMTSESTHCNNFSSIGKSETKSLTASSYLCVTVSSKQVVEIKMPSAISATIIFLGSNSASLSTSTNSNSALDSNGVCWTA